MFRWFNLFINPYKNFYLGFSKFLSIFIIIILNNNYWKQKLFLNSFKDFIFDFDNDDFNKFVSFSFKNDKPMYLWENILDKIIFFPEYFHFKKCFYIDIFEDSKK